MKLFIIRKFVKAKDIQEAIKKEAKQKPDDVYVDEDWKRANSDLNNKKCGFN
jgi:hypothetical protein